MDYTRWLEQVRREHERWREQIRRERAREAPVSWLEMSRQLDEDRAAWREWWFDRPGRGPGGTTT